MRRASLIALGVLLPAVVLGQPRIGPGHEAEVKRLVVGEGAPEPLGGGFAIAGIGIEPEAIRVTLDGPRPGTLVLRAAGGGARAFATSRSLAFDWDGPAPVPEEVRALAARIGARDDGSIFREVEARPEDRLLGASGPYGTKPFSRNVFLLLALISAALFLGGSLAAAARLGRGSTGLDLLVYAGVALLAAGRMGLAARDFTFNAEQEHYLAVAAACVARKLCPLVGQPTTGFQVRLGPLFYQLLVLGQLVSRSPRLLAAAIVAVHSLGAGMTALIGDRALGRPYGAIAGALFALSPALLATDRLPTHADLAPLAVCGFLAATVGWLRSGRDGDAVLALGCLAAATELHAILLALAPVAIVLFLVPQGSGRRASGRALAAAGGVVAVLYLPWFVYQVQTGFAGFRLMRWPAGDAGAGMSLARALAGGIDGAVTPLAIAGVLALVVSARRRRGEESARGRVELALAALTATGIGVLLVGHRGWRGQYAVVLFPFLPLAAAAAARAVLDGVGARFGRERAAAIGAGVAFAGALLVGRGFHELAQPRSRIPTLVEQERLQARLAAHGFDLAARERRLHGPEVSRAVLGTVWIGRELQPVASKDEAGLEALVVGGCEAIPEGFAVRSERVRLGGRDAVLALYRRRLGSIAIEGVPPGELPVVEYEGGTVDRPVLALVAPGVGIDEGRQRFLDGLAGVGGGGTQPIRLRVTLAPGGDRRDVVVAHDARWGAEVRIDGVVSEVEEVIRSPEGAVVHEVHAVPGGGEGRGVAIEVVLDPGGRGTPAGIDLYEVPSPRCIGLASGGKWD